MKKCTPFIFLFFAVSLFSCQDEEDFYQWPICVNEPPGDISWDSNRAYIEQSDLETAEYLGNFLVKTISVCEYSGGDTIRSHYLVYSDFYKIKARRYWGWYDCKEYVSSYKEGYGISAKTLYKVRERIKSMGAAICVRKFVFGSYDYAKASLEITDVIQ